MIDGLGYGIIILYRTLKAAAHAGRLGSHTVRGGYGELVTVTRLVLLGLARTLLVVVVARLAR